MTCDTTELRMCPTGTMACPPQLHAMLAVVTAPNARCALAYLCRDLRVSCCRHGMPAALHAMLGVVAASDARCAPAWHCTCGKMYLFPLHGTSSEALT